MKKNKDEGQMALEGTQEAEMLARLAERVERAVSTIGELRKERDELRIKLEEVEGGLEAREEERERVTELETENERFREQRDQIRERIERLLDRLESLESGEE